MEINTPPVDGAFTRRLRRATREPHQALEDLPFSRALLAQQLPLPAYQNQLLAYWPVLQRLEALCANTDNPAVASVWQDNLRRSHYIAADLAFFQLSPRAENPPAVSGFVADLDAFAQQQAVALVGCLYVFEGSMLGSQVLLPLLRQTFHLQASAGCQYYAACETYPPDHWKCFKHRLEHAAAQSETHAEAIILGAQTAFQRIGEILLAALAPEPN